MHGSFIFILICNIFAYQTLEFTFFKSWKKPYKGDKQDLKSILDLSLLLNSNFF